MSLQKVYLFFLNNIYKIISHIDKRIRNAIVFVVCFILGVYYINKTWDYIYFSFFDRYNFIVLCCGLLLAIFGIDGELKEAKWNLVIVIPYYLAALGILLFGLINNTDREFIYLSINMFTSFPCIWIVWNNRKDYFLYDSFSFSFLIICDLYFLMYFYYAKFGMLKWNGRFAGFGTNPNRYAFFIVMGFICGMFILNKYYKKKSIMIFSALSTGIALESIFLSSCRSVFVVCVLVFISYLIFNMKKSNFSTQDKVKKLGITLISILVSFILATFLFNILYEIQTKNSEQSKPKITIIDRIDTSESSIRSGDIRLVRWKMYLRNSTFTGREWMELPREAYAEDTEGPYMDVHNNIIDITFRFGIPTGICYAIWEIAVIIKTIIVLFNKNESNDNYFFVVLIAIAFFVISNLDVATTIHRRPTTYLFYLVIYPLIFISHQTKNKFITNK